MNELLTAENVSKTFGSVRAVNDISMEVANEEFLAIQGQSGSGKTTLLHLLSGLERADRGTISLDGKDITGMNEDELALFRRENVGIVFQFFNLIPTLNVVENIGLPLFPTKVHKNEVLGKAKEVAERLSLGHRLDHYPNELSGGEQQRVAIARALINEPKIIFADEPTGNLDTETGGKIIELLKSLNQEGGLTVVMVTHDEAIAQASNRRIQLKDGGILNE
jgi:putative ABC transport system ATP-binding protein